MQPGRGPKIDGGTEWDVTEFAVLAYGMIILMGQRIGYAHHGMIIAQTTNQNT